jgi:hypothetical protein
MKLYDFRHDSIDENKLRPSPTLLFHDALQSFEFPPKLCDKGLDIIVKNSYHHHT